MILGAGLAACAVLAACGWFPAAALRVAAFTAGHGVLLGTALGWAGAASRPAWNPAGAMLVVVALLALAATATVFDPRGALAYLAIPVWLLALAARGRLIPLGIVRPMPLAAVPIGFAIGAALGGHLLLSAALTLHYSVRQDGLGLYLAAIAYDVGANIPSGEGFFRGALFNRAQRLSSFASGATLSTAAYLARYLIDPLLPGTVEVMIGAVVYLTLLSVANAWLLWWSGSLVPAIASALVFFAAYRMLGVG
ncbi:MAG TPA: hypothetical protein VGV13_17745 [Methylomirabilota bacterium]|nr:hypothetical protein [Methylomirabilota bacterium]